MSQALEGSGVASIARWNHTTGATRTTRRIGQRALGCLALASAVAALAGAAVLDNGTGSGSLSTGGLALGLDKPVSQQCTYTNLSPGDLTGADTCRLSITYEGSVPAYESVTLQVQASTGASLYDGSGVNGLTLALTDGHTDFAVPTGSGTTAGCTAGSTCWTSAHDLAASYSAGSTSLTFSNGESATFTVTPTFAAGAGNPFQGTSATVTLTVVAVQAPGNPLPVGCTTSSIGQPCAATPSFTWS